MLVLLLLGVFSASCAQHHGSDLQDTDTARKKIPANVLRDLERGLTTDVVISLSEPTGSGDDTTGVASGALLQNMEVMPAALAEPLREELVQTQAAYYRALQDRVIGRAPTRGLRLVKRYDNLPLLHFQASELPALIGLLQQPEVDGVFEDFRYEHQLTRSLPLIQQPALASNGLLGQGTAIAVLDTGCDYTRPEFGSCASPGAAGCKVAYAADFGTNDGSRDDNGHGTNVSAIVLGVAPQTKVLALDVFAGSTARWTDILSAMDWVITHRTTYNIVGVNMSLGGGQYSAPCGGDAMANAIGSARSLGVLTAIASGNNGWSQYMSAPGCSPEAISVGAVYSANFGGRGYSTCSDPTTTADKITCFSNSTSFLSVLAPGASISAGGVTMSGTSQATPHVAGAIAVLRSAFPDESVASTAARLTESGPSITDARNGVTKHRLDLLAALNGEGIADRTAPSGSIKINGTDAFTKSTSVTLTLTGTDNQSAVEICVSNDTECAAFVPFVGSLSWTLPSGDGVKKVYLTLQDASHNKTQVSDTIGLDTTAPSGSSLSIVPANGAVYLNWTPASDAGSGLHHYALVVAQDAPPSCSNGTQLYAGGATSFVHTKLQNGATYAYRLCLVDNLGNVAEGPTGLGQPAVEHGTPFGAVIINGDAEYANGQDVVLTLTATDTSDAAEICLTNSDGCTQWMAFVPIVPWHLDATSGTATVKVWFKDGQGVVSATQVSDSIGLDLGKPSSSTLSALSGNAQVQLSWTSATDAVSGMAGYRIVAELNAAPSCEKGVQIYRGTDTSFTHSGLQNGVVYGYRVCPYDVAGNERDGSSVLARPAPEFDPPVGSVVINAGASYAADAEVTLTLSATDVSDVTDMCISNTSSCSAWLGYTPMLPWTLDTQPSRAQVYVWFRDSFGTISAQPATASIVIDTIAPVNGQLTAAALNAAVSVSWNGVTDASGVVRYKLVGQAGEPPSCDAGAELYSGAGGSFMHSGLQNGTVYGYRLCPIDGAGNLGAGPTASARPIPELDPPTGSVVINDNAAYTANSNVALRLAASDASGIAQMCLSNTPTCQSWISFAETSSWKLSGSGSSATVYAWFRDSFGSTSVAPVTDTIAIDTAPPSAGRLDASAQNAAVRLQWSEVTDALSGVASYKLVGQAGAVPSCADGPQLYQGTDRAFVHSGLQNGTVYSYRLCPSDAVGNMASGASTSATPAPEFDPPVGTLVINAGATFTNNANVTLTLSASDANTVTQVCLSNTDQCSSWLSFATSLSWKLNTSASVATVNAWFRDNFGNTTPARVSDTIRVDLVAPSSGALSAQASNASVSLGWSGATDAVSGVVGYTLVAAAGSAPSCAQGAEIFRGTGSTFTHSGLVNGVSYGYRLCAIDAAGNISEGTTASARPAPEFNGPTGGVIINGNAAYTRERSVSLALSATDASAVTDVCISNTSSCSEFRSFASTISWTLGASEGLVRVYVWYRDAYGNTSVASASDTIVLDSTAPTSGMLSGVAANAANSLSWTAASDARSGIASYKLVAALDTIADCDTGETLYSGSALNYTHSGLQNGHNYGYRICPSDGAGNMASGPSLVLRPAPEFAGPVGSIVIQGGAQYTKAAAVTLTLSAQDPSGVTEMCLSNTSSCLQWQSLKPSVDWTLTGAGDTRVYAWFKDTYGNVNATPYSDSIILDRTAPQAGALQASPGNGATTLTWATASDAGSGIARYELYAAVGAAPACSGTPIYSGTAKTFTHNNLVNGTIYGYRMCPIDGAGNVGSGATVSARPIPESVGPTCSVQIDAGAQYTNKNTVSLALQASDPNGAPEMCISNTAQCSTWTSASTSTSWTLSAREGTATVSVWFKDNYGNITASPCTDSILVDQIAPRSGTLTAEAPNTNVILRWTQSSDDSGGVVSNKLVAKAGEPPSCATATPIYSGTGSSFTHTGLEDGTVYYYRLCSQDAAGNVGEGATASARPISERVGPVGSVRIDAGAEFTRSREVTLTLAASDPHGVAAMCVTDAQSCSDWEAFATTKPWTLGSTEGSSAVRVWFKDDFGNVSAAATSDTIVLDLQSPSGGQLVATAAVARVTLSWTDSADSGSGIAGYQVRVSEAAVPSCDSGTQIYSGSARNFEHTGLSNGVVYGYRVCPFDRAGNLGTAASATAQPKPEFDAPQGSVSINGGAAYATSANVTLAVAATDASGVAAMCLSNTPTCSDWIAFASNVPVSWTLAASSGSATVYVLFKDSFDNVSTSAVSDSIVVDAEAPKLQAFTATPADASVTLTWSANDAISGVSQYRLIAAAQSAPGCGEGTPVYQGSGTQFTHSGLQNGVSYAYRLCVVDVAGNWAADATTTARPVPEHNGPTGSISINAAESVTRSTEVALALVAEDVSGVEQMCISNSDSCTNWMGFATHAPWTLNPQNGTTTVRVWFKDSFGNVSDSPASDSIVLDTLAPGGGELHASPSDAEVRLTWTPASDATTGLSAYVLRSALDTAPGCDGGDELYRGTALSFQHAGLQNGALYVYRLCLIDTAGNVGDGLTVSVRPAPEFDPPTGRVYIDAGARIVNTQQVTLTLSAADASHVTHMCLSNTTSCSDWVAFATSSAWTLGPSSGAVVVRAWFRDEYGNAMQVPTSATAILDMQGPSMGLLNALATPARVYLSWTAASDQAGVAYYTLVRQSGDTAPSSCKEGDTVYSGTQRATMHNVAAGTYAYRLCATDGVGNSSDGVTRSVTVP